MLEPNDTSFSTNFKHANDAPKGTMTSYAHPFFYIIFGGVLFIVFSIIITIFTLNYVKWKYRKFKHSRLVANAKNKRKNIKNHFKKSSTRIENDRVALDMDEVEQENDHGFSQDNIVFDETSQNPKYSNAITA